MITVKKKNQNEFIVVVEEKGDKTEHLVTLDDNYYRLLTQGQTSKEELIEGPSKFLLQRESKGSIFSKFNLKVIRDYFPDFEKDIMK